jgi:TPP-dependent trihydroxycyclohexane-1,2-dione (THcHDO) dehydratase
MNKLELKGNRGVRQEAFQELVTLRCLNLDLTVLVLDNRCLGIVRNLQGAYFDRRNQSTVIGYGHPDFAKVAMAFGVKAMPAPPSAKSTQRSVLEMIIESLRTMGSSEATLSVEGQPLHIDLDVSQIDCGSVVTAVSL